MTRGRIMVMGKAKVTLLLAFQVAAMNVRLTDAYLRTSVVKASSRVRKKPNGQPVVRRRREVPYATQRRARGRSSPQPATKPDSRDPARGMTAPVRTTCRTQMTPLRGVFSYGHPVPGPPRTTKSAGTEVPTDFCHLSSVFPSTAVRSGGSSRSEKPKFANPTNPPVTALAHPRCTP
jgi:hypothetical protein